MSMLDVAKCLYFSKSIDLSHEEDRYFNLSTVDSGHLFSRLNLDRIRGEFAPACVRRSTVEEGIPLFGRRK